MRNGQLRDYVGLRVHTHLVLTMIFTLFYPLFATSSLAQTATTGAIVGRVEDSNGKPVSDVTITVTGVNMIRPRSATSGKEGNVRISNLAPGIYSVSASMIGSLVASESQQVQVNISKTSSVVVLWRSETNWKAESGERRLKSWPAQKTNKSSDNLRVTPISNTSAKGSLNFSPPLGPTDNESQAKQYYKVGVRQVQAKRFEQAATFFTQAIRLKSDYADAYEGLGQAYFNLGRWNQAIDALEHVIKLNPNNAAANSKLREAHARLKTKGNSAAEDVAASGARVGLVRTSVSGPDRMAPVTAPSAVELTQLYRVGIGDVLEVRLSKTPADKSTLFTVTSDGMLEHPILPQPMRVVGQTANEISDRIETQLRKLSVNENPAVSVGIREYVSHTVLVSGLVKNPGTKVLRREAIPLYVVLADAQPDLDAGRATVISKETGEATTVELSDAKAMYLVVQAGDVINVQATPEQFIYIGGEVKLPGEKRFRPGITLTQAILAAGGLSGKAKEVQVARESANGLLVVTRYKLEEFQSGKLRDPLIQPGDRITVVR